MHGAPVDGRNHSRRQAIDVEPESTAVVIGGFFPARQQIQQQRCEPALARAAATARLRWLKRLLPLPWAKITSPVGLDGISRSPSIVASDAGI